MMTDLWQWGTEFRAAHPLWSWFFAILGGVPLTYYATRSWSQVDSLIRRRLGWSAGDDPSRPPPQWQGTEIVRVWTLDALRGARTVAQGTRMAIVDRGVVQFELPAGSPLPGRLDALAKKHALSATAQALQFPAAVVDVSQAIVGLASSSGDPVDAIIKLHVGVDPRSPQRLVESAPIRDGVISVAEVQALVEESVRPWLQARAGQIDTGATTNTSASLANEMEIFLRIRFFDAHGLVGGVRALTFQRPLSQTPASDAGHEQ